LFKEYILNVKLDCGFLLEARPQKIFCGYAGFLMLLYEFYIKKLAVVKIMA
jgi:hypothetical protein